MALIRSISGLRGTLGNHLTPQVICNHSIAFSEILSNGPIVLGRDGRPSGLWIENIVIGALRACGRTVHNLGMVPTPTVQLAVEHSNAAGGIVITASHNPEQWNGLKFVAANGVFIAPETCSELWELADGPIAGLMPTQQAGTVVQVTDAITDHVQRVLQFSNPNNNGVNTGETVVVDAVNCSGSRIIPLLLEKMGYNVVRINCDGTGVFTHQPEPVPENLEQLCQAVLTYNAVFGVAVDPDADRLVLVDHTGKPIGEEYTVTLATKSVLSTLAHNAESNADQASVTVNYSTTRMVDDVAQMYGARIHRSAVGEINVVQAMHTHQSVIGGEGSGGVIYPACHSGRDSVVGLGLIASLLRSSRSTMQEMCDSLPKYIMQKHKVPINPDTPVEHYLERCATLFSDAIVSREDGVHLSWNNRWIHIRASNTEPILRIIAESPTAEITQQLIASVQGVLEHS